MKRIELVETNDGQRFVSEMKATIYLENLLMEHADIVARKVVALDKCRHVAEFLAENVELLRPIIAVYDELAAGLGNENKDE